MLFEATRDVNDVCDPSLTLTVCAGTSLVSRDYINIRLDYYWSHGRTHASKWHLTSESSGIRRTAKRDESKSKG